MLQLSCATMQYEWGKRGSTSAVAALLRAGGGAVDASAPYAELWVGTHAAEPEVRKRFINDMIRSDFHRSFLSKFCT